ncbi:CPBP family intramembrane glutamic endopeptidase [Microbacterium sp. che218]|uniref:CPBP family intramembrane glutamic endopeptidase n=1 Tax=Microbacterium sp. che218 TaxID=3140649 RepID=UPI00336BC2B3
MSTAMSLSSTTGLASTWALWIALSVSSALILIQTRPKGLFGLRISDLVFGVAGGLILRLVVGYLSRADLHTFPTVQLPGSGGEANLWVIEVAIPAFLGPGVEEIFFRAALLLVTYKIARKWVDGSTASIVSILMSTGCFLLLHAAFATYSLDSVLALSLMSVACGAIVCLTGRIWGAMILHVTYNALYVMLGVMGAILQ